VLRALRLKKLEHALVEPRGPEDYQRWSPETGLLPVADVGGVRIADSARILDALDARWPEPPLVSSDPKTAAQQRRLEDWAGETFFFYWERYLRRRTEEEATSAEDAGGGLLARLGIFGRGERRLEDRYEAEFAQRIEDTAKFLGTRAWFYADRIGRADLAVFGFLRHIRIGVVPGDELIERHANLVDWYERTEAATGPPQHRR
jgi:glutathione S-transferase